MAALQSRALAANGFAVLQVDLLGCGDSAGDFGDATWARWVADVAAACDWLQDRHRPPVGEAAAPLWLWGLRVGCLLAAEAASKLDIACDFLFWQPILEGKAALQQFLRLKAAGDMLAGTGKGAMSALRQQLSGGHSIEIAGYVLNPALASSLENAVLRPAPRPCRVAWLEVSAVSEAGPSPASSRVIDHWKAAGCEVMAQALIGAAFWQTTEIEEVPELLAATSTSLEQAQRSRDMAGSTRSLDAA
jgi:exosortase A-associated hydrolase 2